MALLPVAFAALAVGTAPTIGPMSLTLAVSPTGIATFPTGVVSADWTATTTSTGFAFGSNPGLVLAPGSTSTITFELAATTPGSVSLDAVLPPTTGGDVNPNNNEAMRVETLTST